MSHMSIEGMSMHYIVCRTQLLYLNGVFFFPSIGLECEVYSVIPLV